MVFLGRDLLEEPVDLPDCVVPVYPSVVTQCLRDVSLDSDWEFVEPKSSSFSKKRAFVWTVSQEEVRYERSPVKAPPPSW